MTTTPPESLQDSATLTNKRFNRFDQELIDTYFNTEGKAAIQRFIQSEVTKARIAGEGYGRADELTKLYEWGKTIDDQWNKHFEDRLKELGELK